MDRKECYRLTHLAPVENFCLRHCVVYYSSIAQDTIEFNVSLITD